MTALRLAILGPLLGSQEGRARGPGEDLAALLAADGCDVQTASADPRPLHRLLETIGLLWRRRRRLDVVVVMVFSGRGFAIAEVAAWLAAHLVRRPLLLWLHGGGLPRFAHRHPRRVRRVLRQASAWVAPSAFLPRELGLGDADVVPNPLDPASFPYRERGVFRPHVLWTRSLHPIYDPTTAIEALALLRQTHPDARLTLAGRDEGLGERLRGRADELGLGDALRMPGFLPPAARREELDRHDLFLHTSRVDNAPVSVVEAAACGLPVVATRVGGVADLVADGETALLVPPGDPTATAAALRRLVDDPALASRLAAAGRRRVEAHRPERVQSAWRSLLLRVTEAPER